MATVASFSVMEPGTLVPQVRQKRLFAGSSVEHDEQRIIFFVSTKVAVFPPPDVGQAILSPATAFQGGSNS
jgi:hypothetical protein